MPDLFINLVKEEWRTHSTMFGSISFALFPVMIFGIVFMGSFLVPFLSATIPAGDLALLAHAMFLLLGFMVGGFGLLGNEMMNRRFGQASLLVYSARSLPLSERFIFANFVLKDIVYYFFLWVFPFGAGYIAASPFSGVPSRGGSSSSSRSRWHSSSASASCSSSRLSTSGHGQPASSWSSVLQWRPQYLQPGPVRTPRFYSLRISSTRHSHGWHSSGQS